MAEVIELTPKTNTICLQITFVCIFYLTFSDTKAQITTIKEKKFDVFQLSFVIHLAAPCWNLFLWFLSWNQISSPPLFM